MLLDEGHQPLAHLHAFRGIVGNAQQHQHVGKAHDAKAHFAGLFRHLVDLGDGVFVHLDHIVQKMHGQVHRAGQLVPIHLVFAAGLLHHLHQVDGAQVAGFIGQQGLFAAGVCGFDAALGGHHVIPVQPVDEHDAGLAVAPGRVHDLVEHFPGVELAGHPAGVGLHQVVIFTLQGRLHKSFGDGHGNVKVVDLAVVAFAIDELQNIRVVHLQNAHVGAPPGAALLDGFGGGVEHFHKADGARRHAAGGIDHASLGAQAGKGEAGAAAGFVDQGRLLHRFKDLFHRIFHRQHKAGGKLAQGAACVHQGGGVGQELQVGHGLVKGPGRLVHVGFGVVLPVGLGNGIGHTLKELGHCFHRFVFRIADQIAFFQHSLGVFCYFHRRSSSSSVSFRRPAEPPPCLSLP